MSALTVTILSDEKIMLTSDTTVSQQRLKEIHDALKEWETSDKRFLVMSDTEVIDLRGARMTLASSPAEARHESLLEDPFSRAVAKAEAQIAEALCLDTSKLRVEFDTRSLLDVEEGEYREMDEGLCAHVFEHFGTACGQPVAEHAVRLELTLGHEFEPARREPAVVESDPDVMSVASDSLRDTVARRVMRRGKR